MKAHLIKIHLLAIGLLSASGISGQKVITDHPSASGYPVIDLSALEPMGCTLTATEAATRHAEINKQTPSNEAYLPIGSGVSTNGGTWNAKMSPQFQVMRADASTDSCDWSTGYTMCQQYSEEGGSAGQWRLPTQRELQMIWVLYPQLVNKGKFTGISSNDYCTCTERSEKLVWVTNLTNGKSGHAPKTYPYMVRCIRDL